MARRAFYSFHYQPDHWRASQVRNMGVIEGNAPVSDNDWESITKGGDERIKKWISEQMSGKSCVIVLVGQNTANRKWINYEIVNGWNDKKGIVGVRIHGLKNSSGHQTVAGSNPFDYVTFSESGKTLSSVVKLYNPPATSSTEVYAYIADHLEDWVEQAISIREAAG